MSAIREKHYPAKKGLSEDRIAEVELRILNGETLDRKKWGAEMDALAEEYPEEFGYLKKDSKD